MTSECAVKTSDLEMVLQRRNHLDVWHCMYTPYAIRLVENSRWFESNQFNAARNLRVFEQLSAPSRVVNIMARVFDRVADCEFHLASEASRKTGSSIQLQHPLRVTRHRGSTISISTARIKPSFISACCVKRRKPSTEKCVYEQA